MIEGSLLLIGTDQRNENGIGHVYAFDRETGTVRWKARTQPYGFPTDFARSGASLFAANFAGELLAIDTSTGAVRWKYSGKAMGPEMLPLAPAASESRVFFAERSGKVSALDSKSGGVVWSRELKEQIRTSVLLAGSSLYLGTAGKRVFAIDSGDGKVLAEHSIEDAPAGKPTAAGDAIYLLAGGDQKCCSSVVSLDRSLKQVRWTQKAPEGAQWDSPRPLVWKDSLLVGTDRGELHAFKLTDGSLLWKRQFKGAIRSIGSADGILYLGTLSGTVYAYDPTH